MARATLGDVEVLARKAAEQLRRELAIAPEQLQARRLRALVDGHLAGEDVPGLGRRIVMLTPRSWAVHVQWEAILAQALRLRGAEVSFLTCGGGLEICDRVNCYEGPPVPCRACAGYVDDSLQAHGLDHHPLRRYWDGGENGEADEWPELDEMGAHELLDVEADGLPLGRLVDVPVKWFLLGTDLESDPLAPITRRRFLRTARRVARAGGRALDELAPDTIVELNGLFFFESILAELARRRGIDVVSYERGFIHDTLFFRRDAPAVSFDLGEAWDRWKDVPLTEAEDQRLETYLQGRRRGERMVVVYSSTGKPVVTRPAAGRLITLFTNITWDSAVIGRELAFPSIQDWLRAAIDAFGARPQHRLAVRIHPAELRLPGKETREPLGAFLRDWYGTLPANVTLIDADDPTDSYQLMDQSDGGLVYSSTTGMEMALQGLPVITAAKTHYRGKGFTTDVSSPAEFIAALDTMLADPAALAPDRERARRYGYTFFFRALVPSTFVTEPIRGLARIGIESLGELLPGGHEGIDRICGLVLDGAPIDVER